MRSSHEALLLGDDAPTPEQLFSLASRAVVLAKERSRLRRVPAAHAPSTNWHWASLHDEFAPPETEGLFTPPAYSRDLAVLLGRTGLGRHGRQWSMRIISRHHFTHGTTEEGTLASISEVCMYQFGWTPLATTMARQNLHVSPSADKPEISDLLDRFSVPDEFASEWGARLDTTYVTRGDMPLLLREVEEYAVAAHLTD